MVAAVLISMFVSFTLDPMLSSVWHDPDLHGTGNKTSWYGRTVGSACSTGSRHAWTRLGHGYAAMLGWALKHRLATTLIAIVTFVGKLRTGPTLIGTEFVPCPRRRPRRNAGRPPRRSAPRWKSPRGQGAAGRGCAQDLPRSRLCPCHDQCGQYVPAGDNALVSVRA
ncbi:efflux RND transporter permease subunit [Cupriavidus basilensis]